MGPYKNTGPVDCTVQVDVNYVRGKTAVVTGGSDGIGKDYVTALANAGASVIVGDVNEVAGQALASQFENVEFSKCDVTKWDDQLSLFKKALEVSPTKRIDIVIANAGITGVDSIFAFEADQEDPVEPNLNILNVNLTGVVYTAKLALHYFRRQHAAQPDPVQDTCLILQGSMGGYMDGLSTIEYNTAKFGLRGLMRSLRRSAWMHGTRINYIAPGFVKTKIVGDIIGQALESHGVKFATLEDTTAALMRVLCDVDVAGRTLAVLPREIAPQGYMDLEQDDFQEGTPLRVMQDRILAAVASLRR